MKKVTINIKDNKYQFFLELIKNLDFVEIQDEYDFKEDIQKNVINGFNDLKKYKEGKLKTTKARAFCGND